MAKKTTSKAKKVPRKSTTKAVQRTEADYNFFIKSLVFLILGAQWIYIDSSPDWQIPIPIGLIIGLVFATHEHFQIDRKIEYVILLISAFIAFWLPIGLVIQV